LPKHLEKSFYRELSELNSKYRDKLNVHEATKYLLSLEKLSKLYDDKQRLYNSLDIQTTFEKYRIDINKLSDKNIVTNVSEKLWIFVTIQSYLLNIIIVALLLSTSYILLILK
jgi:hypothetical protein